jgi:hypothetical protein
MHPLNRRQYVSLAVIALLFITSSFFAFNPINQSQGNEQFFVGVEFAYTNDFDSTQSNLNNLKNLVDKIKNYTNLIIIGLPQISLNQTELNDSCKYIFNSDLYFIILFTDSAKYTYDLNAWTDTAKSEYGEKFLGVYRIDEPGGKELDNNANRFLDVNKFDINIKNYSAASQTYIDLLGTHIQILNQRLYSKIFTSDYAMYWFDYKAGYETVFTELGWNNSKPISIALCRGAAVAHNKNWGAIITWTYNSTPFIESGPELYNDLVLAYSAGAKYVAVFNYPQNGPYGILTQEHFEALERFWSYIHSKPQSSTTPSNRVCYVLPEGYGFGFRNEHDSIWGIWQADDLSYKVWTDVKRLINQYGSALDIIYYDSNSTNSILNSYHKVFFYNQTIKI